MKIGGNVYLVVGVSVSAVVDRYIGVKVGSGVCGVG